MGREGGDGVRRAAAVMIILALLISLVPFHQVRARGESVLRALLVGSDRFVTHPDTQPAARNNIINMTQALGQDERGYQSIRVSLNEPHDADTFQGLVNDSFWDADDDDVSLIYITTHGLYSLDLEPMSYAMVLSDGLSEYELTADALFRATSEIPGMKILIIDTCNAGALIDRGLLSSGLRSLFQRDDYKILTSSGGSEPSFFWSTGNGSYRGGSYFADTLTLGMSPQGNYAADTNRDGLITLDELHQFLLQNYGVATAQVYPLDDQTAVLRYDTRVTAADPALITNLTLEQNAFSASDDELEFSYTLNRAAHVHYQLIYQENDAWPFSQAQIIPEDDDKPGRKSRILRMDTEDPDMSGYALLYLVTADGENATPHAQALLMAEPSGGDPELTARPMLSSFSPLEGEELPIYMTHAFPLRLTARVLDREGKTVRVLAGDSITRPGHLPEGGYVIYWSGRAQNGSFAPPGVYSIEISTHIGKERYHISSAAFVLE